MTGGTSYEFMIAATNKYGIGAYSSALVIVAGQKPDTPSAPTVTSTSTYVKIAWTAPSSNNVAIDAYKIEIISSNGVTYFEDLIHCDGTDSTIITNLYCLIPMTTLRASPYSLILSTVVAAKISAHNSRGWSATSAANVAG